MSGCRLRMVSKRCHTATFSSAERWSSPPVSTVVIKLGEAVFEGVEGLIQPTARFARRCCWVPELHASIVFEDAFDNKLFSQQNNEKQRSKPALDRPSQPTAQTPRHPFPLLLPVIAFTASPGAGVKAGPEPAKGHPEGLALTPARTAPHCQSREQGKITAPRTEARVAPQYGVHERAGEQLRS